MATKTITIENYPIIYGGRYEPVSPENSERHYYGSYWVDYYPMVFGSPVKISYMELWFALWCSSKTSQLFNTNWSVWIHNGSSWTLVKTFLMPSAQDNPDAASSDDKYTSSIDLAVDLDKVYTVSKIRVIPSSSPGHSSWSQSNVLRSMSVQVTVDESIARQSDYFCGIQHKRYGTVYRNPAAVFVNIDGELKTATEIMVDIGGRLYDAKHMQEFSYYADEKEQVWLIAFTAIKTGTHMITASGDGQAYFTILDADYKKLRDFTNYSISETLTEGNTYYILSVDNPGYGINKNAQFKIAI